MTAGGPEMVEEDNMREMKKLQAKFDAMDAALIKPKEEDLKFECQICMSQIDNDNEAFPLINCQHIFHQECMKQYLKTEVSQSKCPLNCCDPKCRKELAAKDLRTLLSRKDYESFQNYSLQ